MEPVQTKVPKGNAVRRSQRILLSVHAVAGGYLPTGAPFAGESVAQVVNAQRRPRSDKRRN